ncbi:PEP-CTERM sorting domain-containing protein [Candidatus Dependentiae bacterium]|nr:PEP-CTERM sorting domain-containing protein [Candidatus Dependentiae bacterium]
MRAGLVTAVWLCAGAALAQLSPYYITKGTSGLGTTYVMQSGVQQFNYAWAAPGQMPIVIGNFGSGIRVRQACGQPTTGMPQQGDEYQTNGTPTGFTNFWNSGNPGATTAYDAGFNGTNIFMVHWLGTTDGQVFRYDNNYGNGTFLFNARSGDLGITYDSVDNSIWVSNWNDGRVTEYSLGGTQMSQFQAAGINVGALARDPLDDTFWMAINSTAMLAQYSRTGTLLQSYARPDYVLGGEISAIPEPLTIFALSAGIAALAFRRKKKA